MYKVKDNVDLIRDPHTGAILNINSLDHEKYVARREVKNKEHQKVQTIEEEVDREIAGLGTKGTKVTLESYEI